MENKPFTSQYSNIYNEALYRTVPNPYGLKNVTGTQIQNRNIYDTSTISVHPNLANHQQQNLAAQGQQCVNCPPSQTSTMQQQIPGGVRFTFVSSPKFSAPNPYSSQPFLPPPPQIYSCNPGQQEIHQNVNPQLHYFNRPNMVNQCNMQNQTQIKENPYQLIFHYDDQTSTSDLFTGPNQMQPSMGTPDFNNLAGIIETLRNSIETEFPIVVQQSTKILLLTKSPDINQTSEAIREQDKATQSEFVDKELQTERKVSFEDDGEEKPAKKSKKKSNKKRKKGTTRRSSKNRTKCKDLAMDAMPSESASSFSLSNNSDEDEEEEDTDDGR